eukprot:gene8981-biopygen1225
MASRGQQCSAREEGGRSWIPGSRGGITPRRETAVPASAGEGFDRGPSRRGVSRRGVPARWGFADGEHLSVFDGEDGDVVLRVGQQQRPAAGDPTSGHRCAK